MSKYSVERAIELLRIASGYIKDSSDSDRPVFYDEAECDGICLAEDMIGAAEELEGHP